MEFKTWSRVIREVLKESNIDLLYSIILDELSSIDACNNVSSNLYVINLTQITPFNFKEKGGI